MKNNDDVLIISSIGTIYTNKNYRNRINILKTIISVLKPNEMLISNKDEFYTICSVQAAIETKTSFILIPSESSDVELNTKDSLIETCLTISDYIKDEFKLILNLKERTLNLGSEASKLIEITDELLDDYVRISKILALENCPPIHFQNLNRRKFRVTCFHKGISNVGYKYSTFNFEGITKGISKACNNLNYNNNFVIYYESLDLIYDLINGVLAPLKNNCQVKFVKTGCFDYRTYRKTILYTSSYKLEKLTDELIDKVPKSIKWCGLLKSGYILNKLEQVIGKTYNWDDIYLTGKITKRKQLNSLYCRITTIYTSCEIASFISRATHWRLKKDFSVGFIKSHDKLKIIGEDGSGGLLKVQTIDQAVRTSDERGINSFFKSLNTGDFIKINKHGNIVVVSKASLLLSSFRGKLVRNGDIIEASLKKGWVKNSQIWVNDNQLLLMIEPNVSYLEERLIDIQFFTETLCKNLENHLNASFKNSYPVHVVPYLLKGGLTLDTSKIFSRSK